VDEASLRANAQQLLRRLGPLTAGQLARELADLDDLNAAEVPRPAELWHLLLGEPEEDGFCAFPLADDRLCDLAHHLDGLTLTHVLTDEERADGRLELGVDVEPVELLIDDGLVLHLEDGTQVVRSRDHLTGPDGWLPDAPAVVLTLVGERCRISGREQVPTVDQRTADRLAEVHELLRGQPVPVDAIELVLEARARYPRLLSEAHAPLGQLLMAGGLRVVGDRVLAEDEPDPEPHDPFALVEDHLRDDHGLDDEEVADVRLVHDAVLTTLDRLTEALRERLDEAGGEVPTPEQLVASVVTEPPAAGEQPDGDDEVATTSHDDEVRWLAGLPAALGRLLSDEELALVLLEDVVAGHALRAMALGEMVTVLEPRLGPRHARANAAWLRAGTLELTADDHAGAEPLLRRALELDPDHLEATVSLAGYLDDRGRAGAALSQLQRLEGPGLEGTRQLLARYAKPGPAAAGRNEPCPCGSGRKYKVCCQRSNGWPLQARLDWVWHKIVRFITSPAGQDVLVDTAGLAGASPTVAAAMDDIVIVNLALFEGELLQDLCDLRGGLLPADELELLRTWSETRASVQEVVEVAPGRGLTLLDLLTGERTEVGDVSLSRSATVGDAILVWLLPTPAGTVPSAGVLQVPDHRREDLLDRVIEDPEVEGLAAWYASLSALPGLANTDGDPLELMTRIYRVGDPDVAWGALAEHLEEDGPGLLAFSHRDGRRWLMGSITRDGDELTVQVNSAARAAWFHDLITREAPDAELVDEERHPAAELVGRSAGGPAGELSEDAGAFDLDALDPQARSELDAQLDQMMRDHEDAWVDTPLPALQGATPREAAADPTRRDALLRLLDDFERHAAAWDSPGRPMDADRLRRLLHL
jgi:hypothetical protein